MGTNDLVHTLMMYVVLPRRPVANSHFQFKQARISALSVARREMGTVVSQLRISQALRSAYPLHNNDIIKPGDKLWVFLKLTEGYIAGTTL